jgi:hypothetical protein
MALSARKLNFTIRNEVASELEQLVPAGQRSKLVNEALVKELAHFRRTAQTEKLMALRDKTPRLTTNEIVAAVRHDRDRG